MLYKTYIKWNNVRIDSFHLYSGNTKLLQIIIIEGKHVKYIRKRGVESYKNIQGMSPNSYKYR